MVESHSGINNECLVCFGWLWVNGLPGKLQVMLEKDSLMAFICLWLYSQLSVEHCKALHSLRVFKCLSEKWLLGGWLEVVFLPELMH